MPITQIRPNQITNVNANSHLACLLRNDTTEVTLSNSPGEVILWNFNLPGGVLGANDAIYFTFLMSFTNTSGGTVSFTHRFKFGGTTLLTVTNSIPNDANAYACTVLGYMKNNGATNAQKAIMTVWAINTTFSNGGLRANTGSAAIDTTQLQLISLTAQSSTSTPTQIISQQAGFLYYLQNT